MKSDPRTAGATAAQRREQGRMSRLREARARAEDLKWAGAYLWRNYKIVPIATRKVKS